jgi:hypothetical protein
MEGKEKRERRKSQRHHDFTKYHQFTKIEADPGGKKFLECCNTLVW